MSLIMGIHLLERFYLVSDTRVTSASNKSDLTIIRDNLIKAFHFNTKISAVAAGQALPASYILNKLKEKTGESTTISQLRNIINSNLRTIINDYVNTTGHHSGRVFLILAGFNLEKDKKVEASLLGNAMSAMIIARGEGITVNQSIDNRLIKSFNSIAGKGKGDYIEVKDVYKSEMFTISIDIRTAVWELKNVDCFEYAIFHPDQSLKTVSLPPDLLSLLEFRERPQVIGEDQLYEEAEILMSFVKKVTAKYEFWTVGGNIFVLIQIPDGKIFPTGEFSQVRDGKLVKAGSFYIENEKFMYKQTDGTIGEYRHLESISKNYIKTNSKADLGQLII